MVASRIGAAYAVGGDAIGHTTAALKLVHEVQHEIGDVATLVQCGMRYAAGGDLEGILFGFCGFSILFVCEVGAVYTSLSWLQAPLGVGTINMSLAADFVGLNQLYHRTAR